MSLRPSGGFVSFSSPFERKATPAIPVEFGDHEYYAVEMGSLIDELKASTSTAFAKIGWRPSSGPGFSLVLGVVAHGRPEFTVRATGPAAIAAQLLSNPALDIDDASETVKWLAVYPVLKLGLSLDLHEQARVSPGPGRISGTSIGAHRAGTPCGRRLQQWRRDGRRSEDRDAVDVDHPDNPQAEVSGLDSSEWFLLCELRFSGPWTLWPGSGATRRRSVQRCCRGVGRKGGQTTKTEA